jgi:hypothetical protein
MAQRIIQFFNLLNEILKQVVSLMTNVVQHGHLYHTFVVEMLLLVLLIAGARELLVALLSL